MPVDGFYEWRKEGEGKQPFRIGFKEGKPFVFAGLWESWTVPAGQEDAGEVIETYTIVTTDANERIAPIHHRMPVIVDPADYEVWLTGDPSEAANVIRAFPPCDMAFYRVSTRVNNVRNDDESCVEPLKKDFLVEASKFTGLSIRVCRSQRHRCPSSFLVSKWEGCRQRPDDLRAGITLPASTRCGPGS